MSKLIKLGLLAAAGYGTYEVMRRTGMLAKAGEWLEQQIPDDMKEKAYALRDRARAHAEDLANQAGRTIREAAGYNERASDDGGSSHDGDGNGHRTRHEVVTASGPTMTGAGAGVPLTTDDFDGAHVSHKVGRGVVR